jgi:hypothetical protein
MTWRAIYGRPYNEVLDSLGAITEDSGYVQGEANNAPSMSLKFCGFEAGSYNRVPLSPQLAPVLSCA